MYKLVRLFIGSMGENRVEFITPSGRTKKLLITDREKQKLESIKDDELAVDNFLYSIA